MAKFSVLLFLALVLTAGCGSITGPTITASQTTSVPTDIAVAQTTSSSVTLTWSPSSGDVHAYKIYRDGIEVGATFKTGISTPAATTFTDFDLTPSTTYSYSVAASSLLGNETARTLTVSATTRAASDFELDPPSQLTVTQTTANSVTLTWRAFGDGATLTYQVYRNGGYIGSTTTSSGGGVSYTDTQLASSTTYTYSVSVSSESLPSTQVNATTQGGVVSNNAVTTLAGSAGAKGGSADAVGPVAGFYLPYGVVRVGGTLYVADSGNNTIRRIDLASAAASTLAGSAGVSGSSDGVGAGASFNLPRGLATDGTSLYVADSGNHSIRKIVLATGAVSTLAGYSGKRGLVDGIGAEARFYLPRGIASDGNNLYVADTQNNAIRKIVIETGAVITLAGSSRYGSTDGFGTSASFYVPYGIACDGTNLYVSDTGNNTIRKVDPATAQVTTVAGTAGLRGSADGSGPVVSFFNPDGITSDGTSLYLCDTGNNTVREVDLATGEVSTLAGRAGFHGAADGTGSSARFYGPRGIVLSGTELLLADSTNNTIRKLSIDLE